MKGVARKQEDPLERCMNARTAPGWSILLRKQESRAEGVGWGQFLAD